MSMKYIILVALVGLIAVGMLIINNMEKLPQPKPREQQKFIDSSWDEQAEPQQGSRKAEEEWPDEKMEQPAGKSAAAGKKPSPVKAGFAKDESGFIFITEKIICPLKDESMLYVILQVALRYNDKKLSGELEFKKGDITVVIQNVIFTSEKEEITAPLLRRKIIATLNEMLLEGKVQDVVFKDFRIEIRKK